MDNQGKGASSDFAVASGDAAQPVLVPIEPDLVAWFREQGDIIRRINNLCRFYMDTSVSRALDFAEALSKRRPTFAVI